MVLKKVNTPLLKALENYEPLFGDWEKEYINDNGIEEISYERDDIKIVFQEDLREHIVNFSVLNPNKRIINIYFRRCVYLEESLNGSMILEGINRLGKQTNIERAEVSMYMEFLVVNGLI